MKIGITPSIKETYKNQFEYCIDIRLINFLKYCFVNPKNYEYSIVDFSLQNYHSYKNNTDDPWYFLVFDVLEDRVGFQ